MTKINMPTQIKPVTMLAPAADAGGRTSPYISLKHCGRAYLLLTLGQGSATVVPFTLSQAQNVAGLNAKPLGQAVPIYSIDDTDAGDAWTRQPDGVTFSTSATVKNKQILIQVDPALLDLNNGFVCIAVVTGASNALNITSCTALLTDFRYGDSRTSVKVN